MSYELLKNRLSNGTPFTKSSAIARITFLADSLEITQEQADELLSLANSSGLDSMPKDANERLAELEKGVALFYKLIALMKESTLLRAIVDKLGIDEQ